MTQYRLSQLITTFQGYAMVSLLVRGLCYIFPDHSEMIGLIIVLLTGLGFGAYFYYHPNHKFNYFLFVAICLGTLTGSFL